MIRRWLVFLMLSLSVLRGEPLALRVITANLTSDQEQRYSPDNGNHSNPEGAGARILKGLKPDIVLIQEFNTSIPVRQWVNATFGEDYHFLQEEVKGIPNGVISRYPIVAAGHWDDPVLDNREFAWARIRLPGEREVWTVSVHLHSKNATSRAKQVAALMAKISENVPAEALLLLGGDFNTRTVGEICFDALRPRFVVPAKPPEDGQGNVFTNAPRNRPYDWVLACPALDRHQVAVKLGGHEFPEGLVFDSRVFQPLAAVAPVQAGDSGLKMMQHMAVVRDFLLPSLAPAAKGGTSAQEAGKPMP